MKDLFWLAPGLSLGLSFLSGQMIWAQDAKDPMPDIVQSADKTGFQILEKELADLDIALDEKRSEIMREYQDAPDEESRLAIFKNVETAEDETLAKQREIGSKIKQLIEVSESNDESLDMNVWILKNIRDEQLQAFAIEQIVGHHIGSEKLLAVIPAISGGMPSEAGSMALARITKDGANVSIRGVAAITLAEWTHNLRIRGRELIDADYEIPAGFPETVSRFLKKSAELTDEHTEDLFRRAAEKFGDVEYREATIAEFVRNKLKSIEIQKNLQVGKTAPDIEGPDIDGVNFKLSDYRGKVVMVDFWGDW